MNLNYIIQQKMAFSLYTFDMKFQSRWHIALTENRKWRSTTKQYKYISEGIIISIIPFHLNTYVSAF